VLSGYVSHMLMAYLTIMLNMASEYDKCSPLL
jgi:hypothetical protein